MLTISQRLFIFSSVIPCALSNFKVYTLSILCLLCAIETIRVQTWHSRFLQY